MNQLDSQVHSLMFHGKGFDYFKLWLLNAALTLVTLGFYWPWAKVRNMRYLCQNTELAGARFDYHAQPLALLKGHLVLVGTLLVLMFCVWAFPLLGGLLWLAALACTPYLRVRSIKFRLNNTSLRGLRFDFTGSVKQAMGVMLVPMAVGLVAILFLFPVSTIFTMLVGEQSMFVFLVLLVAVVVLGLFLALWLKFRQRLFVVQNSHFGNTPFQNDVSFSAFFGLFLKSLLPILLAAVVCGVLFYLGGEPVETIQENPTTGEAETTFEGQRADASGLTMLLVYLVFVTAFSYVGFLQTREIWQHTRMAGGHYFSSSLNPGRATFIHISNLLLTILTIGLFRPFAVLRMVRYQTETTLLCTQGGFDSFAGRTTGQAGAFSDTAADAFGMNFQL